MLHCGFRPVPAVRSRVCDGRNTRCHFVDDLQWIEPATLTLIEYLLLHPGHASPVMSAHIATHEVESAHPMMSSWRPSAGPVARLDQIVFSAHLSVGQSKPIAVRTPPAALRRRGSAYFSLNAAQAKRGNHLRRAVPHKSGRRRQRCVEFDRARGRDVELDAIVDKKSATSGVDPRMIGRFARSRSEAQKRETADLPGQYAESTLAKLAANRAECGDASFATRP